MRWVRKTGFSHFVLKKLPVGFAAAPFEFAVTFAYMLSSGKYLIDIALGQEKQDLRTLAALPLTGDLLNFWLIALFVGCLSVCVGLLVNGYRPITGLRLERAGLTSMGAMVAFYLYEVSTVTGISWSIGYATILLLLVAIVYKVALIGQALDALTERKHKGDAQS